MKKFIRNILIGFSVILIVILILIILFSTVGAILLAAQVCWAYIFIILLSPICWALFCLVLDKLGDWSDKWN